MAATPDVQTKQEDISLNEKLNSFLRKNRKGFLAGLISILVVLAALITVSVVRENLRKKAISEVDAFSSRYEALRIFANSEEPDAAEKQTEITALAEELSAFESRNSGYAAARAWCISADICMDKKDWPAAEAAWSKAADAAGKTYLAPIAVFNAGVAAEEQANTDAAIAYYTKVLSYGDNVQPAVRAQFSVGRLEESRNNSEAALTAYRDLLSKWPNDPVWSNLAQNRILVLAE